MSDRPEPVHPNGRAPLWLELEVEDFRCAVPVERVREVVRSAALEPVEDAPPGVCGTAISQGQRVPVIDLGERFGLDRGRSGGGRILVTRAAERWFGLRVDRVNGVISVSRSAIQRMPREVLTPQSQYFAGAVLDEGDESDGDEWLILLDVDQLLVATPQRIGR